ncbi:MAG TPA: energy transducer TonB [Rhodanobacteraceae bacterium]|nr:energy transducer TonB [Rhodanobacteraceae bacterium]
MTAITSNAPSWNWLRVGAWSGSFSVHALILLLVAAPAIVPIAQPVAETVAMRLIEAPPPPRSLPEPPPPATPRHVRPTPVHVLPATPQTPVSIPGPPTPVDTSSTDSVDDDPAPTIPQGTETPAGGATQTLAYATPLSPMYPPASLRAREQGTVLLRVLVDPSGVPQRVEIARSSGYARLDTAARDSVLRARFRPVMRDGAAVSAWGMVPIAFRLDRG